MILYLEEVQFGAMSDYNFTDILRRGKVIPLAPAELDLVAAELHKPNPEADPYSLLHILGRGEDASYKESVEPYLAGPDSMLAAKALLVLCADWGLAADYKKQLLAFMRGVAWDEDDDCWGSATLITGKYLSGHSDPELLRALIREFEANAPGENGADKLRRWTAYIALADAMLKDRKTVFFAPIDADIEPLIDPSVLEEAKERLASDEDT